MYNNNKTLVKAKVFLFTFNRKMKKVLLFVVFTCYAHGQNTIDKELEICLKDKVSTADQRKCVNIAYKSWDKLLNETYQKAIKLLPKTSKELLIKAQLQWLKYRDEEFAFINKQYFEESVGTINHVLADNRKMEIVKQRTQELQNYLDFLNIDN